MDEIILRQRVVTVFLVLFILFIYLLVLTNGGEFFSGAHNLAHTNN